MTDTRQEAGESNALTLPCYPQTGQGLQHCFIPRESRGHKVPQIPGQRQERLLPYTFSHLGSVLFHH